VEFKPSDLAKALQVTESTLARWRKDGTGPPWVAYGPRSIRYPADELERWKDERRNKREAASDA